MKSRFPMFHAKYHIQLEKSCQDLIEVKIMVKYLHFEWSYMFLASKLKLFLFFKDRHSLRGKTGVLRGHHRVKLGFRKFNFVNLLRVMECTIMQNFRAIEVFLRILFVFYIVSVYLYITPIAKWRHSSNQVGISKISL